MRIQVKMSTGEYFTISEAFSYGASGPMSDWETAEMQALSLFDGDIGCVRTDEGPFINCSLIAFAWVV